MEAKDHHHQRQQLDPIFWVIPVHIFATFSLVHFIIINASCAYQVNSSHEVSQPKFFIIPCLPDTCKIKDVKNIIIVILTNRHSSVLMRSTSYYSHTYFIATNAVRIRLFMSVVCLCIIGQAKLCSKPPSWSRFPVWLWNLIPRCHGHTSWRSKPWEDEVWTGTKSVSETSFLSGIKLLSELIPEPNRCSS